MRGDGGETVAEGWVAPRGRAARGHLPRHVAGLFRFQPGRPALAAGLRTALALGVPLIVSALLGMPALAWAGMAGLFVALVDKGGPYRTRARAMGAMTVLGAMVGLVVALPSPFWVDVALTFFWVTACGFARSYGDTPGIVGMLLANLFVVSLALPSRGPEAALMQAAFFVAGGLWSMFLALVLWPLRPYRPARLAVAACYEELADGADAVAGWPMEGPSRVGTWDAVQRAARIRRAMETARAMLGATRQGRQEESGRGEHLLVLMEDADALSLLLTAMSEALDEAPREGACRAARIEAQHALGALAVDLRGVVGALTRGTVPVPASWDAERVMRVLQPDGGAPAPPEQARSQYAHVAGLLRRLREYSAVALDVAARLESGKPLPERDTKPFGLEPGRGRSWWKVLREHLTPESVVFRHALRLGLTAMVATALAEGLGLNHWYWVTITVIVVLQPYAGLTTEKGLQRVAGTFVGSVLAMGLVHVLPEHWMMLAVIVVLVCVSVSVRPLNFTVYQVLLAPALVLLAEMQTGDWRLAGVRILNTLMGGVLALLGIRLLWPSPEHARFAEEVARVLNADRDYLREVARTPVPSEAALREARRKVGLALLSAEASFQRLLSEWKGPAKELEPGMALITYARRFTAAVTALAASRSWHPGADLGPVVRYASDALEELSAALVAHRVPSALKREAPGFEGPDALARTQVARLVRQLGVLHHAVERMPPALRASEDGAAPVPA
ncbi:FUSC family protein [Corallococcus aberystwythensis]|uniref:FUSC family protein n=1 Tax=Corallococcus aberystwythensis TaxID=2316722 RepID=A0A3A8QR39_9BACT|nr:FUSC family protein [Corallococcus aberystwythensis]RKH70218.1 FUSC family protein [Corallococcus aberystwythensis]